MLDTPIKDQIDDMKKELKVYGIEKSFDAFYNMRKTFKERGRLGYSSQYPIIDNYNQGIIEGKVYTIGGYSNTGKSKFSYSFIPKLLKEGKKIIYFSLEVDKGMLLGNILSTYYKKDFNEIFHGNAKINEEDFKNLTIYDDKYKLEEIINWTETEKPDIIFIDFVQNIQTEGFSEYEKMTKIAVDLQQLAIRTGISIFNISQVSNDNKGNGDANLKGSGALYASSDVVYIVYRDRDSKGLKLMLHKNKFGRNMIDFDISANFGINEFNLSHSEPPEYNYKTL